MRDPLLPDTLPVKSVLRLLAIPAGGMVIALPGGIAYAAIDVFMPLAGVITVLPLLGFALGLGMALRWLANRLLCSNRRFVALCGFCSGAFGMYIAWVTFEWLLLGRQNQPPAAASPLHLALAPELVWKLAVAIGREGWYSIGGVTPSGVFLWLTWFIESLVVVGCATALARPIVSHYERGEASAEWCHVWSPRSSDTRKVNRATRSRGRCIRD
jgi:hypothetical protein